MTLIMLIALTLVSLAAFSLLHRPLIQLSQSAVQMAEDVSGNIASALRSVTQAFRGWWGRSFATEFTLQAFLGGLILCGLVVAFVMADYTLLVMSISSLFPLETAKTRILGLTLLPADQMAIAIVAGELLFGFMIFELLGITRFMSWEPGWTKRQRTTIIATLGAVLLLLACITSVMAAWRTRQMQQMALWESSSASVAYSIQADSSLLDTNSLSDPSVPPGSATVKPSFLDRLPTPAAAAVGFIVPVATAVAGVGVYWLLLGLCGILSALLVLMPMLVITWIAGVVTRFIHGLYVVLASMLRLLAVPLRIGTWNLSFQKRIDDDSMLPLEVSLLNTRNNQQRPSQDNQQSQNRRSDAQETDAPADDSSRRAEETMAYTRDLEEEVAEYRNQDRRRGHNNTMNPLGIDIPGSYDTEEEEQ